MRKDGKYRFTLQFSANSEEQIRVGELLEKLGNRKSTIIVSALSDYINAHPELQSGYSKIEVKVAPAFDRSQMERLIRSIVEEKLSELHTTETIWKCTIAIDLFKKICYTTFGLNYHTSLF